ncbi:thiol-disulfide isomerase/thioredoxin [Bacillus pakistanensis]|uniref:Thiol-disulfide isomerase/thioredoxin n=1 Tax=Rossellomorea pakistanensis TaxID=992288 RepID=A0ABS2NEA5_9BACI|nr:thioredoxin family protein [Bacillus pakistanensis]MBM7586184.1 thiol-disulfide isomerase/thioredoxin [Bacillus pakistanensis]
MTPDWSLEEIQNGIKQERVFALYLYTPMCGTCQLAGKMLSIVEKTMPQIKFARSDLNFVPQLAEEFSVESVPCLLLFKKNELQDKLYAFHSVPFLYEKLLKLND